MVILCELRVLENLASSGQNFNQLESHFCFSSISYSFGCKQLLGRQVEPRPLLQVWVSPSTKWENLSHRVVRIKSNYTDQVLRTHGNSSIWTIIMVVILLSGMLAAENPRAFPVFIFCSFRLCVKRSEPEKMEEKSSRRQGAASFSPLYLQHPASIIDSLLLNKYGIIRERECRREKAKVPVETHDLLPKFQIWASSKTSIDQRSSANKDGFCNTEASV